MEVFFFAKGHPQMFGSLLLGTERKAEQYSTRCFFQDSCKLVVVATLD